MKAIKIQITSFISDAQPGFVEAEFYDLWGRKHLVQDKVPILSEKNLDENSEYPQAGILACVLLQTWTDAEGKALVRVSTAQPWSVDTTEGWTEFELLATQIIDF